MKNLFLIIGFALALLMSACERPINIGCITPEGSTEIRDVAFASFSRIEIVGDADVFITEGATQEVVIEAASNIIDRLIEDSRVSNDGLILEINGCSMIESGELIVRVTIPELTNLEIRGDGSYTTEGVFVNISSLILDIAGDGQMDLQLDAVDMLSVQINGDGDIECSGLADLVSVDIDGDGQVNLVEMPVNVLDLDIRGDADCRLNIVEEIDININGDGNLACIGTAFIQDIEVSGDALIRNAELITDVTNINLSGDGDVEVNIAQELNVDISGDADVCYRGDGVVNVNISGDGTVLPCE